MDIVYKTFFPTPTNPFSMAIDSYLSRQVHLHGINYAVSILEEDKIGLSTLLPICMIEERNVNHWQTYEISPENRTEKVYELKSHFYMNSIVQTEENLESYFKLISGEIAFRTKKQKGVAHQITEWLLSFRTKKVKTDNRTRLKKINEFIGRGILYSDEKAFKYNYDLFLLIESIRHLTVHSKMILSPLNKKVNPKSPLFKEYFKIHKIDNKEIITIDFNSTTSLLQKMNELTYVIFKALSKMFELPITENLTHGPSEEQMKIIRKLLNQKISVTK